MPSLSKGVAEGDVNTVSVSSIINRIGEAFELTPSKQLDIAKVINQPNGMACEIATPCYIQRQFSNLKKESNENGPTDGDESENGWWKSLNHVRQRIIATRDKLLHQRFPPVRNNDMNAQGQVRKVIKEIAKVERSTTPYQGPSFGYQTAYTD
ncbi:hypothetical protein DFH28DRAFT_936365 [Melampsora americana]|nr:hypothetical protein DFH28DRAFT_936365 [Melampsora americana]